MAALVLQPANHLHALQRVGLVVAHGDEQGTIWGNQPLGLGKAFAVQVAVGAWRGRAQQLVGLLGGAVIRGLQEETGTIIEITDDGNVTISSVSAEGAQEAKRRIEAITAEVEVGKVYEGPVVRILDFGAIINIMPGRDGLLHVSQIANERVNAVSDYLKEGQVVRVKVLETDEKGRVRLSMKALLNEKAE